MPPMLTANERRRRMVANCRARQRYDGRHRKLRAMLEPMVLAGLAKCARCGELIDPDGPWDLGHDDVYPELHSGPEHPRCNRAAPNQLRTSRVW